MGKTSYFRQCSYVGHTKMRITISTFRQEKKKPSTKLIFKTDALPALSYLTFSIKCIIFYMSQNFARFRQPHAIIHKYFFFRISYFCNVRCTMSYRDLDERKIKERAFHTLVVSLP